MIRRQQWAIALATRLFSGMPTFTRLGNGRNGEEPIARCGRVHEYAKVEIDRKSRRPKTGRGKGCSGRYGEGEAAAVAAAKADRRKFVMCTRRTRGKEAKRTVGKTAAEATAHNESLPDVSVSEMADSTRTADLKAMFGEHGNMVSARVDIPSKSLRTLLRRRPGVHRRGSDQVHAEFGSQRTSREDGLCQIQVALLETRGKHSRSVVAANKNVVQNRRSRDPAAKAIPAPGKAASSKMSTSEHTFFDAWTVCADRACLYAGAMTPVLRFARDAVCKVADQHEAGDELGCT
ncbi:hypothetical protein HPB50_025916 [Hyalomma asiaticum]|uniref:Uncharacterized protein n=1 Tax=Hyalomma asiaticum TaxID=266040 RepID=A0ACB7RQE8_HYAAI|nr:hypothetical protein HPB50_025916 [Hyalomma asiaticum]